MRLAAALNMLKAWLLVAISTAAGAGVGWLIADGRGASLFAACSLAGWLAIYAYADRALLGMLGARPFAVAEAPLLRSTVDRLAAGLGVAAPRLYLVDDLFPRSLVVGRGPRGSTLAVSSGLLRDLDEPELTAVLAHEIAHVRARDVLPQTYAVFLAAMLVEASRVGGWFAGGLLYVLGPIGAAFVHLTLSPNRELAADAAAARVTAAPDELVAALLRLERASQLVPFAASPATAPLYPIDLFDDSRLARLFKTHPPLETRIARLRALGRLDVEV